MEEKYFLNNSLCANRVLVVGDVMLDSYMNCNEKYSISEGVQVYNVIDNHMFPGGAANTAFNISELGLYVDILGVVGADLNGTVLLDKLYESFRIDTKYIIQEKKYKTIKKVRLLCNDGRKICRIDEEIKYIMTNEIKEKLFYNYVKALNRSSILVISDYGKGTLPDDLLRSIINVARNHKLNILIDPKGNDPSRYIGASVITPNLYEYSMLTNMQFNTLFDAIPSIKNFIKKYNIMSMILKADSSGSLFVDNEEIFYCPALCSLNVSTIGAGDSLLAGFTAGLTHGLDISDSFLLGNIAASISVSKEFTSTVKRDELMNAYHKNKIRLTKIA